ncbi:MAG: outer membrane beta-barrel protein, partial [Myxococcales bacterium]|nr:outer membrane beta-barrel protein [Myxococcales bacterium]
MKRFSYVLVGLALLSVSGSAFANDLTFRATGGNITDNSQDYDAISGSNVQGNIAVSLGYEIIENLSLFIEYRAGNTIGEVFTVTTELETQAPTVGVRYSYPLLSWLQPFAQVGIGPYFATMTLDNFPAVYTDHTVGLEFYGYAGLSFIWHLGGVELPEDASFGDRMQLG